MGLVRASPLKNQRVEVREQPRGSSRQVFVTGGSGFVGSHLCKHLTAMGWSVVAVTRRENAIETQPGLQTVSLAMFKDSSAWIAALKSCTRVVHLAAHVHRLGEGHGDDSEFNRVNLEGSLFVARCAIEANVARFVFLSSVKANGNGGGGAYDAKSHPEPRDEYGRSKLEAERELKQLFARSECELVVIRPPLVYGPGVKANFLRFMRLADTGFPLPLEGIRNKRSLIGIANLVDFIEKCLAHEEAPRQVWFPSDGDDLSTPELLKRLRAIMRRPARMFLFPKPAIRLLFSMLGRAAEFERISGSLLIDDSEARSRLDWTPPSSVEEELKRTVAEYMRGKGL
jgi:nucleoside-diphosphate-sugar epimerase